MYVHITDEMMEVPLEVPLNGDTSRSRAGDEDTELYQSRVCYWVYGWGSKKLWARGCDQIITGSWCMQGAEQN